MLRRFPVALLSHTWAAHASEFDNRLQTTRLRIFCQRINRYWCVSDFIAATGAIGSVGQKKGRRMRVIPFSFRLKFQRAIPASVFLLAILLILRGMSLGVPYVSPDLVHGSCCH
jgi:hypothetical protein